MNRFPIILAIAIALMSGCSSKTQPGSDSPPSSPVAERVLEQGPPASPEEAFARFRNASQLRDIIPLLGQKHRLLTEDVENWSTRCREACHRLEVLLGQRFGAEAEPTVPEPCVYYMGGLANLEIVKTASASPDETTITVGIRSSRPQMLFDFHAIREAEGWKLVPPTRFDHTIGLEDLRRYVIGLETLAEQVKSGKYVTRQEATRALTNQLARRDFVPGTIEAAIDRFEAALLAWDSEELLDRLSPSTKKRLADHVDFQRQSRQSILEWETAYEKRFGMRPAGRPQTPYSASKCYINMTRTHLWGGVASARVELFRKRLTDDEYELKLRQVRQWGSGASAREVMFRMHREAGNWKLGVDEDDPQIPKVPEQNWMRVALFRELATGISDGRFRTIQELQDAHRAGLVRIESEGRPTP